MGIGESIAKGFGTTKKSMGLIVLLFVVYSVFNLLNLFLSPPQAVDAAAEVPPPTPAAVVVGILFIFLTIFLQGGTMAYIRDLIKSGSASLANFTAGGGSYYLRLLLLGLVVSLIVGVFVLGAALSVGLLAGLPVVGVPLAILCGLLGIWFLILLFLSPYAAVVDERGVGAAIKTSMKLVKRNLLTLLGTSALLVLIGFGVGLLLGAVLAGVSLAIKAETAAQVIIAILSSFVNAYLGVLVTATFMNFYLSLSDRNNA